MAGRFPVPIPQGLEKPEWSTRLGVAVRRWMESIQTGMGGLQGTPATPSEVQAGIAADVGVSQAAAPSDHIHDVDTAVPANYVALGGATAEGTGSALMRASATNVLAQGGAVAGQVLVWDGSAWVPTDPEDADIMNWLNL